VRAVLQRVSRAAVSVENEPVGRIARGLVVFVGVAAGDGAADIEYTTSKVCEVRVFPDSEGRMNRSVVDIDGGLLVISEFTLLGDVRRGRRPSFDQAAPPADAERIYDDLVRRLRSRGIAVEAGRFRTHMDVELVNDGPVTVLVDSRKVF
jgi:D-tyrosyl-tRNA(Tyr) deacylase